MKYKIGIFGSSAGDLSLTLDKAKRVGEALGRLSDQVVVVTGGCPGLPYAAASEAAKTGTEVWGYSAHLDYDMHVETMPDDDHSIYTKLIYVPKDFPLGESKRARMKYRNVISTANCDAGIVISGRWGSLNEFTNLVDQQKVVGVLTGTGGIADELPSLAKKISKEGQGEIIFDKDPEALVEKVFAALKSAPLS